MGCRVRNHYGKVRKRSQNINLRSHCGLCDFFFLAVNISLHLTKAYQMDFMAHGYAVAGYSVSDKRLSNAEAQSSYYTGAIFIYGFLIIIALITVFNIFNSMNASVASRTKQYGIMRSIGMGTDQLYKMIAAEAFIYALLGCVTGCLFGIPLNKVMFRFLIADKWGTNWSVPVGSLLLIVLLCFISAAIAIRRPMKQIGAADNRKLESPGYF